MTLENPAERQFLAQLNTMVGKDTEKQVLMYDVGAAIGLEKDHAGKIAENLFIRGYAEMKTLSGGIGITPGGLDLLGVRTDAESDLTLGKGSVLDSRGQKSIEGIIIDIKEEISADRNNYKLLEEVVMDIKTLEIQMLSPRPKTSICREILRSLAQSLEGRGDGALCKKLETLIAS